MLLLDTSTAAQAPVGQPDVAVERLKPVMVPRYEMACVMCAVVGWAVLFAAGISIDSKPARDALATKLLDIGPLIRNWLVVLTTYTPTNIAFLCSLAAMIGAAGGRLRAGAPVQTADDAPANPYMAALVRGFFVFLVSTSGILVLNEAPLVQPTAEGYIRLAGFLSLVGFIVGYTPTLFSQFLMRIAGMIEAKPGKP